MKVNEEVILVIADSFEYIEYYIRENFNFKILLFQDPSRKHRDKPEICEEIFYFNLKDTQVAIDLTEKISNEYAIKAVCSFTDEGLELASILSNRLNLVHNPLKVVNRINNKFLMREYLNKNNFSDVSFATIKKKSDLIDFANANGYPFILKPVNGTGSKNVVKIENIEFLEKFSDQFHLEEYIAEEYIFGNEFSVETISFNGNHNVLAITEKKVFTGTNVEEAHLMPAAIDDKLNKKIQEFINKFLSIMGQKNGPCHIELKVNTSNNTIRIIEAHTRPGGDFIVLMLLEVMGVDIISETINFILDFNEPNLQHKKKKYGVVVKYFHPRNLETKKIKKVIGFEEVIENPFVINYELNFDKDDNLPVLKDSFSRLGCLVVRSADVNTAYKYADQLTKKIRVVF